MARTQNAAIRGVLAEGVARCSPFYVERLQGAGVTAGGWRAAADLESLPAVGERDLCPQGDASTAARLVCHLDETDYARLADGPDYRRGLLRRVGRSPRYERQVESAVRPLTFHLGGLALALPIASTRGDLDLIARAGNRAWQVLGLQRSDVLLSVLAPGPSLEAQALSYAAVGAGAPALHATAGSPEEVATALGLLPVTVLAVSDAATLATLLPLPETVRTVLAVGGVGPLAALRAEVAALVPGLTVLSVWGPPDGRVLYAQCPAPGSDGALHTYPDLDLWQLVDPATGEAGAPGVGGELVLTQLGFLGSALLRWRTGAVTEQGVLLGACPGCGRSVPRIAGDLVAAAVAPLVDLDGAGATVVDLRTVAAALAARSDLDGWVVQAGPTTRRGGEQLVVRLAVAAGCDPATTVLAVDRAVRQVAGVTLSQLICDPRVAGAPGRLEVDPQLLT